MYNDDLSIGHAEDSEPQGEENVNKYTDTEVCRHSAEEEEEDEEPTN